MTNHKKYSEAILTKFSIILIVIFFLLYLFVTFSGVYHSSHLNTWGFGLGLFPYTKDVFLNSNIFTQTSILYSIIKFLKININNDIVGFAIHITLSTFSGFFLYKIIKEFTFLKNNNGIIIVIFSILTIDNHFLIDTNYASWVIRHTGTTTHFGHAFIYIFFWALLKRFHLLLAFLSVFMLLIAVKPTFFSIGIGIVYSLFFIKPFKKNIWILAPLITVFYLSNLEVSTQTMDYDTRLFLFNNAINRESEEASFHLQPALNIFLFIFSFPIFYFLKNKIVNDDFKNFLNIVMILSIMCFVWGYFYHVYGGKIWPKPELIMLGPTRAVEVYELFFSILIALAICKLKTKLLLKIGLLSLLFYAPVGLKGSFLGLLILLIIYLIIIFYQKFNFLNLKKIILNESKEFSQISTIVFFIIIFPLVLYVLPLKDFDYYGFKKINRWKTGPLNGHQDRLDSAVLLQKCPDFILFDPEIGRNWTNAISGKSQFVDYGELGINLLNVEIIDISNSRKIVYLDIKKALNHNKKISKDSIEILLKTGVVLIVSDNYNELFPENITRINLDNKDTLILFLNKDEENFFIEHCKQRIKI